MKDAAYLLVIVYSSSKYLSDKIAPFCKYSIIKYILSYSGSSMTSKSLTILGWSIFLSIAISF